MREELLHFLWNNKFFCTRKLKINSNENLEIINTGSWNNNSGPDFLNAQIYLDNQLWVGNIEIHVKSSDWYTHQHELDTNYDAVILHVVWEYDVDVFMKNQKLLPTLELKTVIEPRILRIYEKLMYRENKWIHCQNYLPEVGDFIFNNWLERLYFERLEKKTIGIRRLLLQTRNDYEAVLFYLIAKGFGLKVNSEAFLKLAMSFPFKVLKKVRFSNLQLSALFFGQAGFLESNKDEVYYNRLKKEYIYIKKMYDLKPMKREDFEFFRVRPFNFPTIRIAQLVALVHKHSTMFSRLIKMDDINSIYHFFSLELDDFWKEHYTFDTVRKKRDRSVSKYLINSLIINVIVPLKFVFMEEKGYPDIERLLYILDQVEIERNAIISKFSEIRTFKKSALSSQALIELKTNYCDHSKCLKCAIGNHILKKEA